MNLLKTASFVALSLTIIFTNAYAFNSASERASRQTDATLYKAALESTLKDLGLENKHTLRVILQSFSQPDINFSYKIKLEICRQFECTELGDGSDLFSQDNESTLIYKVPVYILANYIYNNPQELNYYIRVSLLNGKDEKLSSNFVTLKELTKNSMNVPLNKNRTRLVTLDFH